MGHKRCDIVESNKKAAEQRAKSYRVEALSESEIDKARDLLLAGATWAQISELLERKEDWLRENYTDRIGSAAKEIDRQIINKLARAALDGNVTAQIFWAKCRAQWRDNTVVEHVGKDGGAIQIKTDTPPQESYEEWLSRQQPGIAAMAAVSAIQERSKHN